VLGIVFRLVFVILFEGAYLWEGVGIIVGGLTLMSLILIPNFRFREVGE
jgi:hypothetical protein